MNFLIFAYWLRWNMEKTFFVALCALLLIMTYSCRSEQIVTFGSEVSEIQIVRSQKRLGVGAARGVKRVVTYHMTHPDVPASFEGFRIAFVSDLHYESLLKKKGLDNLVCLLNKLKPDVLLLGGDYQEGCEYVDPLFSTLSQVETTQGIYGVMGNNDYERCYDEIVRTMKYYGIHALEHRVDTLRLGDEQILIAGVRNPFQLSENGVSPTLSLSSGDFVVLLTHTPDYAEDVDITHTDLVLAGHTHGGQVRILGITPIINSHYGKRFLTGVTSNSSRIPVVVTNGVGTSRLPIRIGAPSEVVMVILHSACF